MQIEVNAHEHLGPPTVASASTFPSSLFLSAKCVPGSVQGPVWVSPWAPPSLNNFKFVALGPTQIWVVLAVACTACASQWTVATTPVPHVAMLAGWTLSAELDVASVSS